MRRLVPLLILVIGVLAVYIDMPGSKFVNLTNADGGFGQTMETKLGLDLRGGFEIKYGVTTPAGKTPPDAAKMEVIRSIVEKRVNSTGVSEPIVETVGTNEILVQVPGASDPAAIEKLVGATGQLSFVLMPKATYGYYDTTSGQVAGTTSLPAEGSTMDAALLDTAQFTGDMLDSGGISASVASGGGGDWQVNFAFAGSHATDFETWTGAHIGEYFAIVLDGKVQSIPYIKSAITGGTGSISGTFTVAEAKNLATILQYGALPYPIAQESSSQIAATLGKTFLNQTIFAGAIGIGLVLLFMLTYYRLPGLVAALALTYYAVAVLAVFRIVPVTLTLAGIAAFVISVGMAVDANILIFERTKEELRAGKTLATASEAGFSRAWNSIFDSNMSSLITAGILYMGGSSTIKGFALVLIIGVATSMFTAVTVSRTLMRIVVRQQFVHKAWLFGVTDAEFQARAMGGRLARRETRGRV
ncbi:MAG TPA: protein translocase subunit SecD [Candidatus Limnocylindrales bacterium]